MTTMEELRALGAKEGLPGTLLDEVALPAVRLIVRPGEDVIGASRLGGLPDLPTHAMWPRWDAEAYDAREIADAEARAHFSDYVRERLETLRRRAPRRSIPLSFLAQIDLRDLGGFDHGLPLPAVGHLYFFYELSEQPWGYCPTHRGASRVLFAPEGAALARRQAPDDLGKEWILSRSTRVCATQVATIPTWPVDLDDETLETYQNVQDEMSNEPEHQIGGHPDQIQGDMKRSCALVTKGVYLGGPPDIPREELDRLAADADEWKLLLQLVSDEDLGWMWGDLGNLYYWMRASDIESGAWEAAWLELQCT
jgi:uncharacterized protein YwqG